jgi:hypothetical protein
VIVKQSVHYNTIKGNPLSKRQDMRPMTNKKTRSLQNKNRVGLEQDFFLMNKILYKAQTQHPYTPVKTGNKSCIGTPPAENLLKHYVLQTTNSTQLHCKTTYNNQKEP